MKRRDKIIVGTVLGGAIGSVLGLLFAPQAGKKTRQEIKEFKDRVYLEHGDKIDAVQQKSKKLLTKATDFLKSKMTGHNP